MPDAGLGGWDELEGSMLTPEISGHAAESV
jgi:hypothetical protein